LDDDERRLIDLFTPAATCESLLCSIARSWCRPAIHAVSAAGVTATKAPRRKLEFDTTGVWATVSDRPAGFDARFGW
jgi:hypothetical protein